MMIGLNRTVWINIAWINIAWGQKAAAANGASPAQGAAGLKRAKPCVMPSVLQA